MSADPAVLYLTRKAAAMEALAGGRLADARSIIEQLLAEPAPAQRGVCRMCGCSEARACAILVPDDCLPGSIVEPRVERCFWADDDCTVCTNVSCLERWRREAPAEMDVDVHDAVEVAAPTSRIVRP